MHMKVEETAYKVIMQARHIEKWKVITVKWF